MSMPMLVSVLVVIVAYFVVGLKVLVELEKGRTIQSDIPLRINMWISLFWPISLIVIVLFYAVTFFLYMLGIIDLD